VLPTLKQKKNLHFQITCLSRLYELYQDTSEKYIEEDNPHVLLASASPVGINVNLYHSYDQVPSSLHDSENNEQSDAYMTGVQGKFGRKLTKYTAKLEWNQFLILYIVYSSSNQSLNYCVGLGYSRFLISSKLKIFLSHIYKKF
jgi:hypothetical protein